MFRCGTGEGVCSSFVKWEKADLKRELTSQKRFQQMGFRKECLENCCFGSGFLKDYLGSKIGMRLTLLKLSSKIGKRLIIVEQWVCESFQHF